MPAKSKQQASAFGMALAARRGDIPADQLQGAARQLYKDSSLSESQLEDYASTKRSDLPEKKTFGRRHRTFKRG